MYPEDCWSALLEELGSWAAEVVARPDGIEVHWTWPDGAPRKATVVVTPAEWEGVVSISFGSFELALADLGSQLEALSGPQRFLVHQQYRLVPSATRELTDRRAMAPEVGSGEAGHWHAIGEDAREYPFPQLPPPPR